MPASSTPRTERPAPPTTPESAVIRLTEPAARPRVDDTPASWHRPLLLLAAVMAVCAVVAIGGLVVDDRVVTGQPVWAKPLKFALSIAIYAVTWAWLLRQLNRFRRTAWWLGTVSAVMLGVEMIVIVAAVLRGTTSHFNVSDGLNATLWAIMGIAIVVVWVATFVVSLFLMASPGPDRARNLAVRLGALISVGGMAVAFLMVLPTAAQLQSPGGVIGAHSVGVADDAAGLPLLGWSTQGGDLRIPHFVGMHALQMIPLALIVLELLSRRVPVLRREAVRARLVVITASVVTAVTALLTWQALRGQSIVRPDLPTGLAAAAIVVAAVVGVGWSLAAPVAAVKPGRSTTPTAVAARPRQRPAPTP